jgi:hypothetical protein
MSDLVVLVADADMRETVSTLIARRHHSLAIRGDLSVDITVHPNRDAGCYQDAHTFLRPYSTTARNALVLFDHHGCGQDQRMSVEAVQDEVEARLVQNGWSAERVRVIVIAPELEAWVWTPSSKVDEVVGWHGRQPALRDWLQTQTPYWGQANPHKPEHPKEALQQALRHVRKPFSPSLFGALAGSVSLNGCIDPSFQRFRDALQAWYPAQQP